VPNPLKTVIYRIMQEAFNNVAKHSNARLVDLSLQQKGSRMEFVIQDDGQGFDQDAAHSQQSVDRGLASPG